MGYLAYVSIVARSPLAITIIVSEILLCKAVNHNYYPFLVIGVEGIKANA
jgi:hypothetical protein